MSCVIGPLNPAFLNKLNTVVSLLQSKNKMIVDTWRYWYEDEWARLFLGSRCEVDNIDCNYSGCLVWPLSEVLSVSV